MSKKDSALTLKEAINRLIESYKIGPKLYEAKLIASWGKIMGPMIERHTRNLRLKGKTLYLEIGSASLRQELDYSKSKVIERVNEALDASVIDKVIVK
jgi:hypothetical protein